MPVYPPSCWLWVITHVCLSFTYHSLVFYQDLRSVIVRVLEECWTARLQSPVSVSEKYIYLFYHLLLPVSPTKWINTHASFQVNIKQNQTLPWKQPEMLAYSDDFSCPINTNKQNKQNWNSTKTSWSYGLTTIIMYWFICSQTMININNATVNQIKNIHFSSTHILYGTSNSPKPVVCQFFLSLILVKPATLEEIL